jgi:hypothetical protein
VKYLKGEPRGYTVTLWYRAHQFLLFSSLEKLLVLIYLSSNQNEIAVYYFSLIMFLSGFFLIPLLLYFNSTLHLTPYFYFHFLSLFALLSAFLFYLPPLFSPTNLALTVPSLLRRRRVFPILDVSTAVGPEDR